MAVVFVTVMIIIVTVSRQQINKIMINSCRYKTVKRKRPKKRRSWKLRNLQNRKNNMNVKQQESRGRTAQKKNWQHGWPPVPFQFFGSKNKKFYPPTSPTTCRKHSLFGLSVFLALRDFFGSSPSNTILFVYIRIKVYFFVIFFFWIACPWKGANGSEIR